jgi:hypothetical protein
MVINQDISYRMYPIPSSLLLLLIPYQYRPACFIGGVRYEFCGVGWISIDTFYLLVEACWLGSQARHISLAGLGGVYSRPEEVSLGSQIGGTLDTSNVEVVVDISPRAQVSYDLNWKLGYSA